jgi:alkaline phosphatase D
MKRRDFLQAAGVVVAAEAASMAVPTYALSREDLILRARLRGLNILQGLTSQTTTQLTVDVPKGLKVSYRLTDQASGKAFDPARLTSAFNAKSEVRVDRVSFEGLELGHDYTLQVKDTLMNVSIDERNLSTVDLSRTDAKIAVLSCMRDSSSAIAAMWASASAAQADYYFFIGDATYGDSLFSNGPDKLWSRFVETRTLIPFYQWKNLKPTLAIWDDHDFGKNDSGGDYKHKVGTLQVFKSFFGQEPLEDVLIKGPGLSMIFKAFGQNFVFADCRYFRGLKGKNKITGFLGQEQMSWISSVVSSSQGPVWILEGSPFYGRTQKSAGASYGASAPAELSDFLNQVRSWKAPAILFGGDLHFSEVSSLDKGILGYQSYEFISSSMHSSTKSVFYDNPNKRLQGTFKENFMLLEKQGLAQDATWDVKCIGAASKILFSGIYNVG